MSVSVHPHCAWVLDEQTDTIYVLRLPGSTPLALEGVAALIFGDIADGRDPVAEAITRWPEGGDAVAASTEEFVASLIAAGLVQRVGDTTPQSGQRPRPVAARRMSPDPTHHPDPVRPFRVLFVCTANICRSAYAEAIATAAGMPGLEFSSAGTQGWVDHGMDPPMAAVLPTGVDASQHHGRQLTRARAEQADLVVALSIRHRAFVLDEWPTLARKTFVIGHVARELASLPPGSAPEAVAEHLWAHRSQHADDSVADPYRRGPEAAAACAARLDSDVSVILERLATLNLGGTHG